MSFGSRSILAVKLLIVGSSDNASWVEPELLSTGFCTGGGGMGICDGDGVVTSGSGVGFETGASGGGGGLASGVGLGTGAGDGAGGLASGVGAGSSGCGCGDGRAAIGPGRLALPGPGTKEKSSAREEEIQGICFWREARVTPTRVRLSVSSAET